MEASYHQSDMEADFHNDGLLKLQSMMGINSI